MPSKRTHSSTPTAVANSQMTWAVMAAIIWAWSLATIADRGYEPILYIVISPAAPLWGWVAMPVAKLVAILVATAFWIRCAGSDARVAWALLASGPIPLLDLARASGISVPVTFLEPLGLMLVTSIAAARLADSQPAALSAGVVAASGNVVFPRAAMGLAIAAGGWWYAQAVAAYDSYLLGFHDFGHFAQRVASTANGDGFLRETPSLPPFWDHFNPGLVLLTPLWRVWPDPRLFLVLQAACLSGTAPLVYAIARRHDASPLASFLWSASYLLYPAVGQLNLNYTYGWHPESLALPLLAVTLHALLRGRRWLAATAALAAASFGESAIAVLGCLAASMIVQSLVIAKTARNQTTRKENSGDVRAARDTQSDLASSARARLCQSLPLAVWLGTWIALVVLFLFVHRFAGFAEFQRGRVFSHLGNSLAEILVSPITRPRVFWIEGVLRTRCGYFLLLLLVPLASSSLPRGWPALLATSLPLSVLLIWSYPHATSIAFQYSTTLIPLFFLAAIMGASTPRRSRLPGGTVSNTSRLPGGTVSGRSRLPGGTVSPGASSVERSPAASNRQVVASGAACAACLVASLAFGAMPWSRTEFTVVAHTSYPGDVPGEDRASQRMPGSPGHATLDGIVTRIRGREARILATSRLAAHLIGARRLEPVDEAINRWQALQLEAGEGHSAVEVFDWIALDTFERFQQNSEQIQRIIREAERLGYERRVAQDGVILLVRPHQDSLD